MSSTASPAAASKPLAPPTPPANPTSPANITGTGSTSPAISNTSAKLRLPLRVISASARDRVNNILEEGRRRSLAMADAGRTERDESAGSPFGGGRRGESGRSDESLRTRTGTENSRGARQEGRRGEEAESSADEDTSIMRGRNGQRQSGMNYQGTMQAQTTRGPLSRSNPSTASIRRAGRIFERPREGEGHNRDGNRDIDRSEEDEGREHESWWVRLLSDYGSIELENKGSVARDHLALERTFLAWLRTSLAFASIGIAITQLFRLNITASSGQTSDPYLHLRQIGKPLGATFLGISIVMLFVGFHRYFESQHWIIRGKFPASRGSVVLVAGITLALMVTSLVVVVAVEPTALEKR